jgi:hypothetical protein
MNDMNDTPKDALWDALDNIVTLVGDGGQHE